MQVTEPYVFDTTEGERTFPALFGEHEQLLVYHLMMGPDWEAACPGCTYTADTFDRAVEHLPPPGRRVRGHLPRTRRGDRGVQGPHGLELRLDLVRADDVQPGSRHRGRGAVPRRGRDARAELVRPRRRDRLPRVLHLRPRHRRPQHRSGSCSTARRWAAAASTRTGRAAATSTHDAAGLALGRCFRLAFASCSIAFTLCAVAAVVGRAARRARSRRPERARAEADGWAGAHAPARPAGAGLHASPTRTARRSRARRCEGKPVVYAFVYSTCRDTCPAQVQTIRGALDDLERDDVTRDRHLGRSRQRHAQAGAASFLLKQSMTGPDGVPAGHPRAARAGLEGVRDPAAAGRTSSTPRTRCWPTRSGFQRIGFPFDHLTAGAPRARSRRASSNLSRAVFERAVSSSASGARTSVPRWRRSRRTASTAACARTSSRRPARGKTLLGVELIRRVGKRALVLAPNQGIQQQWPRAVGARSRARPRRSPAPTCSSRSPASPTRRCASSRTRRSCSAGSRSRAGRTSARPPPA